ncbi:18809_t:CDS:10, partial [Acaulospora morrowiae]
MNHRGIRSENSISSPENDPYYGSERENSSYENFEPECYETQTDDDEQQVKYNSLSQGEFRYEQMRYNPNPADQFDEEAVDLTQEECWTVVSSFFEKRGIVRQQTDSFDDFIQSGLQEVIEQNREVVLTHMEDVDNMGNQICKRIRIEFGQLLFGKPTITESDGSTMRLYPQEARLRNLTYASPLFLKTRIGVAYARVDDLNYNKTCDDREEFLPWKDVFIGKIPIMVKSSYCSLFSLDEDQLADVNECPYDQGGYFIINGSEKVLIAQERLANNMILVFKTPLPSPYAYTAEIKSSAEKGLVIRTFTLKLLAKTWESEDSEQYIHASMPFVKKDIPLKVLFVALGVSSEQDILQLTGASPGDSEFTEAIKPCLREGFAIQTRQVALDYIGKRATSPGTPLEKRVSQAKKIIEKEFLPHIGDTYGFEKQKAHFLGYMVRRLVMCALGRKELDDRDHFGKKRLDLAGALLSNLFNNLFRRMVKDMTTHIKKMLADKREINLEMILKPQTITNGMRYSLGTGNWGESKRAMQSRSGVAQVLNRFTYVSTLSHLRRCNTPISRDGKVTRPRYLHNTHWGYLCPSETPEGQACGLMKNLALMAYISVGTPTSIIVEHINATGMMDSIGFQTEMRQEIHSATKVLINGNWIGVTDSDVHLYNTLKDLKKSGDFPFDVSIVNDIRSKEIRVYSDPGRICRPLFVVNDSKLEITPEHVRKIERSKLSELGEEQYDWEALVYEGLIEYLDAEEEEFSLICMTPEDLRDSRVRFAYESMGVKPPMVKQNLAERSKAPTAYSDRWTHCEIHPSMILGVSASLIPFPDHNQSPRNTYQSAMGKQAMGIYATNYQSRMDVIANILYYPQKPLVTTKVMEYLKFRELPAGHNAIVAILCYEGYNQEDSIIMNQGSVDRGMFRSFTFKNYQENDKQKGMLKFEEIMKPTVENTVGLRLGSADKLDVDGVVAPGTSMAEGDIIIGKTTLLTPQNAMPGQKVDDQTYRNISTTLRRSETGFVDHVVITSDQDSMKSVKVRVRNTRVPEMGDKFASRHGQKGTIGILYRQEDMPFTCDGIIPDIIINPHAIPSRMTVGHLIECLLGKLVVITGNEGDSTPFTDVTVESISSKLKELGHQSYGNEVMYNGYTGKKLRTYVFIGPTYYQRLKHMVHDKIHSRSRGPLNILTRQPVEGRSREGGLRFGEMERDCMISHGASLFLKERLFDVSDPFSIHVCDLCGLMAIANPSKGIYECRICKNSIKVSQIEIPYACKMLFQELMSMNISPRFTLLVVIYLSLYTTLVVTILVIGSEKTYVLDQDLSGATMAGNMNFNSNSPRN